MPLPLSWLLILGITAGIAACAISAVDQQLRTVLLGPPADHLWLVVTGEGQVKVELLGVKFIINGSDIYRAVNNIINAGEIKLLEILTWGRNTFNHWISPFITG